MVALSDMKDRQQPILAVVAEDDEFPNDLFLLCAECWEREGGMLVWHNVYYLTEHTYDMMAGSGCRSCKRMVGEVAITAASSLLQPHPDGSGTDQVG